MRLSLHCRCLLSVQLGDDVCVKQAAGADALHRAPGQSALLSARRGWLGAAGLGRAEQALRIAHRLGRGRAGRGGRFAREPWSSMVSWGGRGRASRTALQAYSLRAAVKRRRRRLQGRMACHLSVVGVGCRREPCDILIYPGSSCGSELALVVAFEKTVFTGPEKFENTVHRRVPTLRPWRRGGRESGECSAPGHNTVSHCMAAHGAHTVTPG